MKNNAICIKSPCHLRLFIVYSDANGRVICVKSQHEELKTRILKSQNNTTHTQKTEFRFYLAIARSVKNKT